MRLPKLAIIAFALTGLAGCRSGVDALRDVGPSGETTSSVARPSEPVGGGESGGGDTSADEPQAVEPMALAGEEPAGPAAGQIYGYGFGDAHPVDFGRFSPQPMAVHGVDVSRWQGTIDWDKLRRQGANFAYIKATDGADHLDPRFAENWRGAAAAGIRRGAYHFFYWCSYASAQADWFISNVPKEAGALPPVLDVEWNHHSSCKTRPPREKVLEKMQVFLDRLEAHYGQRPVIYATPDFYKENLREAFTDYPFWLRSVAAHPSEIYPERDWVFWQYSGSGLSHGVEGRIDLNVFHGNAPAWRRWVERVTPGQAVADAE